LTSAGVVTFLCSTLSRSFKKQEVDVDAVGGADGAMVLRASRVSCYERPDMLPESSMRKTVSKVERKEKSIAVEREGRRFGIPGECGAASWWWGGGIGNVAVDGRAAGGEGLAEDGAELRF